MQAFRALVDPENPPRKPYLFEHHFLGGESADISRFQSALEERGFRMETVDYDPVTPERAWRITAVKLDLLEERRVLALSDEMDALAREHDLLYDGWLTHVE